MPLPQRKYGLRKSQLCSDYFGSSTVPYNSRTLSLFWLCFSKSHFPYVTWIPHDIEYYEAFARFAVSLDGYIEAKGPMDAKEIIRGTALGPSYAKYLKELR